MGAQECSRSVDSSDAEGSQRKQEEDGRSIIQALIKEVMHLVLEEGKSHEELSKNMSGILQLLSRIIDQFKQNPPLSLHQLLLRMELFNSLICTSLEVLALVQSQEEPEK